MNFHSFASFFHLVIIIFVLILSHNTNNVHCLRYDETEEMKLDALVPYKTLAWKAGFLLKSYYGVNGYLKDPPEVFNAKLIHETEEIFKIWPTWKRYFWVKKIEKPYFEQGLPGIFGSSYSYVKWAFLTLLTFTLTFILASWYRMGSTLYQTFIPTNSFHASPNATTNVCDTHSKY